MKGIQKTNAARILDRVAIEYILKEYEYDENDLSAQHVAMTLGVNPKQVFKTLVLKGDKTGYFVVVIPSDMEVDLKAAASVSKNKNCDLIPMKDLLSVTGYIRGGCSPIGLKKPFPVFFDSSVVNFDKIFISAGQRGKQFFIAPEPLIAFTKAKLASLAI
ncbi:MAG: Cys-tRNA(Pro) deacylase [Alistipes sp.]|nr:Cys-tRNA(Pro) deacylase [Candidatus Alistipes equi]